MTKKITLNLYSLAGLAVAVFALLAYGFTSAEWVTPAETPPNGNTPAPINVGPDAQVKVGNAGANILAAATSVWSPEYCDENGQNCFFGGQDGGLNNLYDHILKVNPSFVLSPGSNIDKWPDYILCATGNHGLTKFDFYGITGKGAIGTSGMAQYVGFISDYYVNFSSGGAAYNGSCGGVTNLSQICDLGHCGYVNHKPLMSDACTVRFDSNINGEQPSYTLAFEGDSIWVLSYGEYTSGHRWPEQMVILHSRSGANYRGRTGYAAPNAFSEPVTSSTLGVTKLDLVAGQTATATGNGSSMTATVLSCPN